MPAPRPPSYRRPRRRVGRRSWGWLVATVVAVVVIIWLGLCAWQLWRGSQVARQGVDAIDRAKGMLSGSDLVAQRPLAPLSDARRDFGEASSYFHSPLLTPLRIVPVVGRQVASLRSLSQAAGQVSGVGIVAIGQAHEVLRLPHQAGPERIVALRKLSDLASATHAQLEHVDLGPPRALIGPIASRHDQFQADLDRVRTGLSHSAVVTSVLADLIQGPTSYLLLAANNAEMRSGSGAFLQVGVVSAGGGHVQLGDMSASADHALSPDQVPIGGDLAARWGWLHPNAEWRNLGLTPQFDTNGSLASRMWLASTGQHVDGVMAVDVETLRQLLGVTGPVTVDGTTVGYDNADSYLLHDQYAGLSEDASAQQGRRDKLGDLARATVDALESRSIDLSALATAVSNSAQGRHLLLWSGVPSVQAAWEAGGVAGRLGPDDLLTAVINQGGNKLDPFLSVTVKLHLSPGGGRTQAVADVHVANDTPEGEPSYVQGPYPGIGTEAGEYVGLLAVNVAGNAASPQLQGQTMYAAYGPEGPTFLMAVPVDLKRGQSRDFEVRFGIASPHGSLRVVPTARIPPVQWSYGGDHFDDASTHVLSW